MNSLLNFGLFSGFAFDFVAFFFLVVVGMFLIGSEIGSGLMMFSCFADIPILNTSH